MRNYVRKTQRGLISEETMRAALDDIWQGRKTVRKAGAHYGIKTSTLAARLRMIKDEINGRDEPFEKITIGMGLKNAGNLSKYSSHQVFSNDEENLLQEYLVKYEQLNYGITIDVKQKIAYHFAASLGAKMPMNWYLNEKAGKEWATGFTKRMRNLPRMRNLNVSGTKMEIFYNNLEEMMRLNDFMSSNVWNIVEISLSSFLQSPDALAPAGAHQVDRAVSERGEQITLICIVNAAGVALPPVYLFPRESVDEEYMEGSAQGSTAVFNGTGWMDEETFVEVLKHILTFTAPSRNRPIMVLLNSNSVHSTHDSLKFCHENGIDLISFPPNTTDQIQPLDDVIEPFKRNCRELLNSWLTENPGEGITVANIIRVSAEAIQNTFIDKEIQSGFANAGIYPLNRDIVLQGVDPLGSVFNHFMQPGPSSSSQFLTPAAVYLPTLPTNYLPVLPEPPPVQVPKIARRKSF